MKPQRAFFKWLAVFVLTNALFQFPLMLPSASAQGSNTPTPTATFIVTDINQDGMDDNQPTLSSAGIDDNQPALNSAAISSAMILNQQIGGFSIGMIETGEYEYPRDRLTSLGYSVTMIPPTSGLSIFQQYDIIYLPVQWAEFGIGNYETNYETIETHATDYHTYVYQGGALFIDQPDPNYHPDSGDTVTPSILPYPITFYAWWDQADYPPVIVDPNHFITSGLAASEVPFPFDPMINIDPFYHVLVTGGTTGSPSLAVGEYGAGRILVQTAHPATTAIHPFSDTVYTRMIEWVGGVDTGCSNTIDLFEPDNTRSTGSTLSAAQGAYQRHTLCPQNDEDWANLQSTSSQPNLMVETFDLEPDDINSNANTKITVEDTSQTQIGINLDRGLGPFPGSTSVVESSRVVWHPATGGVFNIQVIPETQVNEQESSGYSLRIANPSTNVTPVDQASWGLTEVNVPLVWRNGNVIYFTQFFTFSQMQLDALINLDTTFAWEFRRPAVDTVTGIEENGNVDFGDYWRFTNGVCIGEYGTNLPNAIDDYSEESNLITGCEDKDEPGSFDDEEFEVFVDDPSELIAGRVYWVTIKFYVHSSYLNNDYQFYIAKAEHCKKQPWPIPDEWCNVLEGQKSSANLIEGYLQPAP